MVERRGSRAGSGCRAEAGARETESVPPPARAAEDSSRRAVCGTAWHIGVEWTTGRFSGGFS
eukprot:6802997-Prymnesium_polylepis.1